MTTQQAIEFIQLELGKVSGVKTKLDLSEKDIQQVINRSLIELTTRVDTPALKILPYSSIIDISEQKIAEVYYCLRSEPPTGVQQGVGMADPFYASGVVSVGRGSPNIHNVMQTQLEYAIRAMAQNTIQTDLTHITDLFNQKLYISYSGMMPRFITLVYKPKLSCVEDLPSDYWSSILLRLATGFCKIITGNLWSKYTIANNPIQINGSALIEQGTAAVAAVYEQLKDNNLFFNLG